MAKVLLLIVEDEMNLAKMYATKLKIEGFDVDIANDGVQGFEKMKVEKPGLVLMDIMMPNLNGLEALKRAKQDPEIKHIPIMMLTNLSGTAELHAAINYGAIGYIVKSELTPSEVVAKIKDVLIPEAPPVETLPAV
jgi:two-component system alkaline phosphatase synthesis response regulator PhoP